MGTSTTGSASRVVRTKETYQRPLMARLRKPGMQAVSYFTVITVGILFLFPWIWLLSTSLKPPEQIVQIPPRLIPNPFMWINYVYGITSINFPRYLLNTLILCAITIIGRVFSCTLVGYSLANIKWAGRGVLFAIVLATMMLPGQVTLIPIFIMFSKMGWVNTFLPLTVPAFFGDAFFIFMFRQFFLGIPTELTDAARLDGANHLGIFLRIVLPLSRPVLATMLAFTFINTFNNFQGPLIYLKDRNLWTLSLGMQGYLQRYGGGSGTALGAMMAGAAMYTLPMIVVFFLAQKWFIQGIVTTGFK
jgi:multiple sugar transport system permease protein